MWPACFRSLSRHAEVNFRTRIILGGTNNKMELNIFVEIKKRQMNEEK